MKYEYLISTFYILHESNLSIVFIVVFACGETFENNTIVIIE